jgi:hypothetical protein
MLSKGWDYNMNYYVKEFLKRGLMFSGLGPIVAGIVYLCIEKSGTELNLSGSTMLLAIITTYIIAFIHAGSSVFNIVESWSRVKGLFFQLISIYIVYTAGYLLNSWLPLKIEVIIIYTVIFVLAFLTVWLTIFFITKNVTKKLNDKLNNELENQ